MESEILLETFELLDLLYTSVLRTPGRIAVRTIPQATEGLDMYSQGPSIGPEEEGEEAAAVAQALHHYPHRRPWQQEV